MTKTFFKPYRLKLGFTLVLILLEAGMAILFPLFIGYAIDSALAGSYYGAFQLGALGIAALVVGVGRRVFDSRFYAQVYQRLGMETMAQIKEERPSVKAARLGMIREMVSFFEDSLPELIGSLIGLVGVVAIIATLNLKVFCGSLIVTVLIGLLYRVTSKKTTHLNRRSNDELEHQIDIIASGNEHALGNHLQALMKWNIKLSDLEATNFSVSWILLMLFLVGAITVAVGDGIIQYGALFALVMYVFQYMESVVQLPLFYQNWLRLREIRGRFIRQ